MCAVRGISWVVRRCSVRKQHSARSSCQLSGQRSGPATQPQHFSVSQPPARWAAHASPKRHTGHTGHAHGVCHVSHVASQSSLHDPRETGVDRHFNMVGTALRLLRHSTVSLDRHSHGMYILFRRRRRTKRTRWKPLTEHANVRPPSQGFSLMQGHNVEAAN